MNVTYQKGEYEDLLNALSNGTPPILFVFTGELQYWDESTLHALVLSGVGNDMAYVNKPAFAEPVQVKMGDLLLTWGARENSSALIQ